MAFGNLVVKLSGDISDFAKKLDSAKKQMNTFSANAGSKVASSTTGITKFAEELNKNYGKANAALQSHNLGLKDTARIVQGILVSQAFYQVAGAIREATASLIEFNENLDYAQVTFSALLGGQDLASGLLNELKELSVNTIFDYDTLEQSTKKLLAYGIEAKNVMFIMGGLTNLGAMSGDTASLDRIAYALGQVYAKGKLSAEEMRQLSNAYVPIKQILRDSFGLTDEQLGDVGSLNIPAEDAINAIVDYANEKFGAVGDAAMYTITGLKNRITDSFKVLGSDITQPLTTAFKSFLAFVDSKLSAIREAYANGGMGGVLDLLVPDETKQQIIRQFIANLQNAFVAIVKVASVIGQVLGQVGQVAIMAFNIIGPFIIAAANAMAEFLNAVMSTQAGVVILRSALIAAAMAMVLLRIQTIGALVITALSKAVLFLSRALLVLATIVTKHPIIAFIVLLAGALLLASGASDRLYASLSRLFGGLGGGAAADDVFQDANDYLRDMEDTAGRFNDRLGDSNDAVEDLNENLDRTANRASKALLSFDEVFKLSNNSSGLGDMADDLIDLGDFGDLGLGDLGLGDLEIPDFSEYADMFAFKLSEELQEKVAGAGIGALIGGAIGAALGGAPGAYIGAAIGAFAGWFWGDVADKLGLNDAGAVALPIATGLGAAIGAVAGGPAGAVAGAAIGSLVGWLINGIVEKINDPENASWTGVTTAIGGGIGAAIGFVVGGPAGAAIGGAIGVLAGEIIGEFADSLSGDGDADWEFVAASLGGGIGAAIGMAIGGPGGAAIGAAIGAAVGYIAQNFITADWSAVWEGIKQGLLGEGGLFGWSTMIFEWAGEFFAEVKECFDNGDWAGVGYNILMGILSGLLGAVVFIVEPIARLFTAIWNAICEIFGIHSPAKEMEPIGANILLGILEGMVGAISQIPGYILEVGLALIGAIGDWFTDIGDKVSGWLEDAGTAVGTFVSSTGEKIQSWASNTGSKIRDWASNTKRNISDWWTNVKSKFDSFKNVSFSSWCSSTLSTITSWASSLWRTIKENVGNAIDKIREFFRVKDSNSSSFSVKTTSTSYTGHATGGIFDREHIARFAEGNKAEAIIPLEEKSAMQPFVDAVANGLTATLAPILASTTGGNQLQPLYVGTLIADDNSLKELERKMEVIRLQESRR